MSGDPHELREQVFRELVKIAGERPQFKRVMDTFGFFTAMELVDGIVDALAAAGFPPPAAERPEDGR